MGRLDDYRMALLAAFPSVPDADLARAVEDGGNRFASFIVDHGLGPLWHTRTRRAEFRASRLAAEALYATHEQALQEIDTLFNDAGIDYTIIKGAGNRLLLYSNPALRACYDIDLLVARDDRLRAASLLANAGFTGHPNIANIGHELKFSRSAVDVDLHWGLLREGRLKNDNISELLDRRRRVNDTWMLSSEDALITLLVHPAFAKHLGGWEMGLHRVVDIVLWLISQPYDWHTVRTRLGDNGVRTAAWATLRWVATLAAQNMPFKLESMLSDLQPGSLRRIWIDRWLRSDLPGRTSRMHWARLLGFSLFLHDTLADAYRALTMRRRAYRGRHADLEAFEELFGK